MQEVTRQQTTLTAVAFGLVIWAHVTLPGVIGFSIVLLVLCAAVALSARATSAQTALGVRVNSEEVDPELRQLEAELHSQMDQYRTDQSEYARRERELTAGPLSGFASGTASGTASGSTRSQ